jgi:hypothetical protein
MRAGKKFTLISAFSAAKKQAETTTTTTTKITGQIA